MKISKVYIPVFIIGILINMDLVSMKSAGGSERYKDFIREVSKVKSDPVILSGWYYEMEDLNEKQDALRIATVKGINISGQEDKQKKIKDQLLKDNIKNIEEGQILKALPKDMNLQISKIYFSNLIKRTDFQNEKELIDSLNEFNKASKVTNQVVREYLKKLSQTDQKHSALIVAGDPVKTFSKQFTALKLDLIDRILKNIMKVDKIDLMSAVAKFEAYNFSKYKSKTDSNYSDYLNKLLLNSVQSLYSSNDDQLLKLGADPNWLAPEQSINTFYSGPAFFVKLSDRYSDVKSIDLMLKYGADPNLSNPDNMTSRIIGTPLHVLVGAATHKYENNEHVVNKTYLLLKHGANPMFKGPAGKSSLEYAKEKLKQEISDMSYVNQGKYYSGLYKGSPQVVALNKIIDLMNNADKIRQDFLKQSGQTKK